MLHSLRAARNYRDWIVALVEPHLGEHVLEIGPGLGMLTDALVDRRRVTAIEPSERSIAELRRRHGHRPNVQILHADATAAGGLGVFDSVLVVNVLEHIAADGETVRALSANLRPGGKLVVFAPAFERLYSVFDRRVGHYRRYEARSLAALMQDAGLDLVDVRYVNVVGAVAWWLLARQLKLTPTERWLALPYDRLVVPAVRRLEARWKPPFGQSVLCIGARPS